MLRQRIMMVMVIGCRRRSTSGGSDYQELAGRPTSSVVFLQQGPMVSSVHLKWKLKHRGIYPWKLEILMRMGKWILPWGLSCEAEDRPTRSSHLVWSLIH